MTLFFQALWLKPAYHLEFEGQNTFIYIWLAGIAMFVSNMVILYSVIKAYIPMPEFKQIDMKQNLWHQ